jgi:type III pantothenate kinase
LEAGADFSDFDVAVMSSVVPPLTAVLAEMLGEKMGKAPLVVGPGIKTGIRIRTDNPVEVGSDIVANAVAGHTLRPDGCVVVAFGTAITFSAVTKDGDLIGVAIAPGMHAAAESLVRDTAQLRLVEYSAPPGALGKNTIHSLQSGLVFGFVGLVEGLVDRIRAEHGMELAVISTGEQARALGALTDRLGAFEPWLTLDGLRLIAERNR